MDVLHGRESVLDSIVGRAPRFAGDHGRHLERRLEPGPVPFRFRDYVPIRVQHADIGQIPVQHHPRHDQVGLARHLGEVLVVVTVQGITVRSGFGNATTYLNE